MDVYVIKRPGVDQFLQRLSEHYELLIYTASLSKYADPLLDKLDVNKVLSRRLYRENCAYFEGHYVKDLYLLNRDLSQTIIVDNSPMSYKFHTKNAIDCGTFIDDPSDTEMWQIADFLISIAGTSDVTQHCNSWKEWCKKQSTNYASFINPIANKPNPVFVAAPSTVTNVKPTAAGGGTAI
jgi:carboxy-terminal domain RNA polymerase II polypeptide A small phosphatase